jgi:FixJ family two-component response regulator
MASARPLVAVVDDDESIRRAIERLLRSAGMNVVTYSCGANLLASIGASRPDCVVLDLHMPVVTGFDVQAVLAGSSLPVIVITGHDTAESRRRALVGGACAYLPKPVSDVDLLDAIAAAIADGG